ncbi:MAG: DUF4129 domain-containing protein [Deltaproteobacteria bacterium]|nr:DUF4129 domain-containing protein [Deltaproteobacteria bacterium]
MLGRAFLLARQQPRDIVATSVVGSVPLLVTVLALYWLEEVERVRSLRPLAALVLVVAWGVRSVAHARVARTAAAGLWDAIQLVPARGLDLRALRTAVWTGFGLLPYLAILLAAARIAPAAVYFALPLLALRGLVAPGTLARSACFGDVGFAAAWRALRDHRGRRGTGFVMELLLFLAFTVVAVNLYAFVGVALLLGRSLVGIDLTGVESFVSPRNSFVLLLFGGAALLLVEPVRAALSAVMLVDAQVRQRGLDLRMRVDEAIGAPSHASAVARVAALALILASAAGLWGPDPGLAQESSGPGSPSPNGERVGVRGERSTSSGDRASQVSLTPIGGPRGRATSAEAPGVAEGSETGSAAPTPADLRAREETRAVLARPEFREDGDTGRSARDLVTRLLRWIEGLLEPDWLRGLQEGPSLPSLPGGPVYLVAAAILLALVIGYLLFTYVRKQSGSAELGVDGPSAVSSDPRERPPEAHLEDAARLAHGGRFRDALRALYLATLVSLDRRRLIRFDTTRTNWQYLRDLPGGTARIDFAGFTRLFDHKWYGDEPTTHDDYVLGRGIAERLCRDEDARGQAPGVSTKGAS